MLGNVSIKKGLKIVQFMHFYGRYNDHKYNQIWMSIIRSFKCVPYMHPILNSQITIKYASGRYDVADALCYRVRRKDEPLCVRLFARLDRYHHWLGRCLLVFEGCYGRVERHATVCWAGASGCCYHVVIPVVDVVLLWPDLAWNCTKALLRKFVDD